VGVAGLLTTYWCCGVVGLVLVQSGVLLPIPARFFMCAPFGLLSLPFVWRIGRDSLGLWHSLVLLVGELLLALFPFPDDMGPQGLMTDGLRFAIVAANAVLIAIVAGVVVQRAWLLRRSS